MRYIRGGERKELESDTICFYVGPRTTTPPGSPPKDFIPLNENANPMGMASQPQNTSSILQALANMAKTNASIPGQPPQAGGGNVPNVQNMYPQSMPPSVNAATTVPPFTQAVNAGNGSSPYGGMSSAPNFLQSMPQMQGGQMNMQANPPLQPQSTVPSPEQLQQQVQIIQMLQAQGVPQDQWAPVLSVLMAASAGGGAAPAPQPNFGQNQYGGREEASRDRNGYGDQYEMRSPSGRHRRSRSRSPSGYDRRRDASPRRRRDSPSYGSQGRGDDRFGRGGGNPYRQRSPDRHRRSDSPGGRELPPPGPKRITYDHSIPPDNIKGKPLHSRH